MAKGMFTQCLCILLRKAISIGQIETALKHFELRGRHDANEIWAFSGPSVTLAYLEAVNGYVTVDVVDSPWPDGMGDPQNEPMIFGAWSMGHFGPFAFPGGLQRAAQHCWNWEPGRMMPMQNRAFIRIRSSYAFGIEDDAPIQPREYAALPEIEFVTKVTTALLELPDVLCYFNPNGEVLRDRESLQSLLNFDWSHSLPAIDAWTNVRLFGVNAQWSLMDTVGNGQLDLCDSEACFRSDRYNASDVDHFLRNVSLYLLNNGPVIKDGDTMDGPGGLNWQCRHLEKSICDPPREVLRWLPLDGNPTPEEIG